MTLHQRRIAPAFVSILLVLTLAALLAACTQPATTPSEETPPVAVEPAKEAVLVRAMTSEPAKIDPQGPPSAGLSLLMPYLFDTLVVRDIDNAVLPFLADSWTVAGDGLTITMTLKSGVTFHDGEPLNAEAVRFTFERFKASGMSSPIYASIQQIDAMKRSTVDSSFPLHSSSLFWAPSPCPTPASSAPLPPASSTMPARAT